MSMFTLNSSIKDLIDEMALNINQVKGHYEDICDQYTLERSHNVKSDDEDEDETGPGPIGRLEADLED